MVSLKNIKEYAKDKGYTFEYTDYSFWDYFTVIKPKGRNWFELRVENTETNRERCMIFLKSINTDKDNDK